MMGKKTIDRLVTPSFFSTNVGLLFTCYVFAVNIWPTVKSYPVFSQMSSVFVERVEIVNSDDSALKSISGSLFNSAVVNNVVYMLAWALVGILVYLTFLLLSRGFQDFKDTISISRAVNVDRVSVAKEISLRILLHSITFFVFVAFLGFFVRVLFPVASASIKAGSSAASVEDWKYLTMAFVIVVLSVHIITVLTRLLVLRVRVFGGSDELVMSQ